MYLPLPALHLLLRLHLVVLKYLVFCFAACVFIMFTLEPPLESIILAISTLSAHTTARATAIGSRLVAQPNGSGTATATDTDRPSSRRDRAHQFCSCIYCSWVGVALPRCVCVRECLLAANSTWGICRSRQTSIDTHRILMLRYYALRTLGWAHAVAVIELGTRLRSET